MKKRTIFIAVLLIIWMVVVFCFSAQTAMESREISQPFAEKLFGMLKLEGLNANDVENLIRKIAHFVLYMLGGILLMCFINITINSFEKNISKRTKDNRKFGLAVILGALYAVIDETHQLFSPGRGYQISDMIIDSAGVFAGALCVFIILKIRHKAHN